MKTLIVCGVTLGLAFTAAPAFAKGLRADVNNDGRVTLQESQQHRMAIFTKWDRDRDGRLSLVEFQQHQAAKMAKRARHAAATGAPMNARPHNKRFAKLDMNRDGFLTPDEVNAAAARRFARLDRAHAGFIAAPQRRAAS